MTSINQLESNKIQTNTHTQNVPQNVPQDPGRVQVHLRPRHLVLSGARIFQAERRPGDAAPVPADAHQRPVAAEQGQPVDRQRGDLHHHRPVRVPGGGRRRRGPGGQPGG